MEVLAVAVWRLADANAPRPAEDPFHVADQCFGLIQPAPFAELTIKRNQEHEPECIGPQVPQSIGPNPLRSHPVELREDIGDIAQHSFLSATTPQERLVAPSVQPGNKMPMG